MGYTVVTYSRLTRTYREHSSNISHAAMRDTLERMVIAFQAGHLDNLPFATIESLIPGQDVTLTHDDCRRDLPALRAALAHARESNDRTTWVLEVMVEATARAARHSLHTLNYA